MVNGLLKIAAHTTDYSLVHTFGATPFDVKGLPEHFSVYDGRPIPDQNDLDSRFTPAIPPLPYGCTAETGTFDAAIQDAVDLYNPQDLYGNTPPGDGGGRDIRKVLGTLISRGPRKGDGVFGAKRTAYFNCYGANKISDFDAVRIALWINQSEKRGVWVGSWWYSEFNRPDANGILPLPSFNTTRATLHCYLVTGWKTIKDKPYLEVIAWQGKHYGKEGVVYLSEEIFNALMAQPYTGSFTITKVKGISPVPIGFQAIIDHLVYYLRNLFEIPPLEQKKTL